MTLRIFRFLKYPLYLALSLALFFGIERLTHCATDGFQIVRILNPLPKNEKYQVNSLSSADEKQLEKILDSPFSYLNCGGQSYVFESEDKEYVMKFFKFHHVRIPIWMQYVPLTRKLKAYRNYKIAKKDKTLNRTFSSYAIAFNHFKEETGLVYLHLGKTSHLRKNLQIIDKIKIKHELDADNVAFVIQKKGILFYEKIDKHMRDQNTEEARKAISEILDLSIRRCQKGIGDEDPDFCTNFGFINEIAVQLDMGRFFLDEKEKDPNIYKPEIYRITRDFRSWLDKNYPTLVSHFDKEIENIKGDMVF
ncbi:MAG: hypothetical protein S4CHLAM37_12870 [Chlamydiia bacterium]|nr:hypothetical protein [Chlamydiia bacterium]